MSLPPMGSRSSPLYNATALSTPPEAASPTSPMTVRTDSSQRNPFSNSQPSLQPLSFAALITREVMALNPTLDNSSKLVTWVTDYVQQNEDLIAQEMDNHRRSRRNSRVMPLGMSQMSGLTRSGSGTMEPDAASTTATASPARKRGSLAMESSIASSGIGERLMSKLNTASLQGGGDSPGSKPSIAPGSPLLSVTSLPVMPQIEHVESVLEMKAKLRDPRYFTEEQLVKERFHSRSRAISAIITPLSILMIFFTAVTLAMRIGLGSDRLPSSLAWAEMVTDIIWFVVVVGMGLLMPFEEDGQVVTDLHSIALRYLKTLHFALFDVISHFPVLILLAPQGLIQFEYARANLLLREVKMPMLIERLEDHLPRTLHPSLMRLLSYFLYLLLIITHLSTVFMAVIRYEGDPSASNWVDAHRADSWYWFSRAWREMLTLIAEKRLSYPHEDAEYIASIFLVVCALVTISVILASFEEIIVTEIDEGSVLNTKIESTLATLEAMRVPPHMQQEIVEYYERMWEINRTFDFQEADLLAELPESLKADVDFECNSRMICQIPIFAEVSKNPDFVRLLAGQLQQIVVMPGAPIVLKGEEGDCMFFMISGIACVMDDDGLEEDLDHPDLEAGAFFGEVTMLFGGKRDRTIAAKTVCVCSVVTAAMFDRVVDVCPEALQGILDAAVAQIRQVVESNIAVEVEKRQSPTQDPTSRNNSTMGSFAMRRFAEARGSSDALIARVATHRQTPPDPEAPLASTPQAMSPQPNPIIEDAQRPSAFSNMQDLMGVADSSSDHEPEADVAARNPDDDEDDVANSLREHLAQQFMSRRSSLLLDFDDDARRCSVRVTASSVVHAAE